MNSDKNPKSKTKKNVNYQMNLRNNKKEGTMFCLFF